MSFVDNTVIWVTPSTRPRHRDHRHRRPHRRRRIEAKGAEAIEASYAIGATEVAKACQLVWWLQQWGRP